MSASPRRDAGGCVVTFAVEKMNVVLKSEQAASPLPDEPDDLLTCLQVLAAHHGRPSSVTVLTAGLPLIGEKLTPELFMRSAEHIGLSARRGALGP